MSAVAKSARGTAIDDLRYEVWRRASELEASTLNAREYASENELASELSPPPRRINKVVSAPPHVLAVVSGMEIIFERVFSNPFMVIIYLPFLPFIIFSLLVHAYAPTPPSTSAESWWWASYFPRTAVRRTEYVRDSQGRIIEKIEEISVDWP